VTVRISPFISGLKPFADVALARIPANVLAGDPDGRTVLQLMSAGAAAELMTSPASAQELLASATKRSA
jgi:urease gamma subunit